MPDRQSLALIGLSGVGKSSVGQLLAQRLGLPLYDTDALIVQSEARTIAQIFAEAGEERFRDLESAALQRALSNTPCVVSTGGGIVLRPENRALLREHAFVVWLDAPTATLVARLLSQDEERPLVGGADPAGRMEALRAARAGVYAEVAHVSLNTAGRRVEEIAAQILQLFTAASIETDRLIGQNWSAIRQAARTFLSQPQPDAFEQAVSLYAHPAWEVRSFALALLGGLA
ncbi:MAG TPA: shikimate kinase, partial [Roseiflexaceae bacterium]|nr:shikimate kinase [Roseiflexaceae bacterium]